ncbi:MAG: FIG002473: Protein YcaR in KDO2-Lipid A biosynthesis cluster, partial [uncultured Acidimicrobiales bacterium]
GPRPAPARDPRLPRGQGAPAVPPGRGRPLQPSPEAALRRPRRHPGDAHRRGHRRRRGRARQDHGQGRRRRPLAHLRADAERAQRAGPERPGRRPGAGSM